MQPIEDIAVVRRRLLVRLGVVVGEDYPFAVRVAAVRAIQQMLTANNPLRLQTPEALVDAVKAPWDMRKMVVSGRAVDCRVSRPPQCLGDVW